MRSVSVTVIISLALLFPILASAAGYRVKASVVDSEMQPEIYVTWRIFSSDSTSQTLIAGSVTDDTGAIDASLDSPGEYRLSLQGIEGGSLTADFSVSDESPVADLGFLTLTENESQQLDEVTVTAQKPLVVKEIDRLAYDVKADPEASTAPLIDILRKVPMVTVDGEGNISVNGSSNFKIYKNGRPNNSFTKNAKELFKAIPASSIRKVEVITDPGAREDAEGVGAILNIVTDSDSVIEGITGSVSMYGDSKNPIPTPNVWLSTQIGKVTFSVSGNYYNLNRRESESFNHSRGYYNQTGQTLTFDEEVSSTRNAGSGGFEMSYEPDTLNLFTASMDFYNSSGKLDETRDYLMTSSDGEVLQKYTQTTFNPLYRYLDIDGGLNYQRSTRLKGENITLSYQISTTGQKQKLQTDFTDAYNLPAPYTGIRSNFDRRFVEHTFQLDWTRPIAAKHTLDVGAKYITRRNHSKNHRDYVGSNETYDDFNHNTDIAAGYADFRAKFGKVGVRAGLRYEYSRLAAKFHEGEGQDFSSSINDYVPNATVSYSPNDANSLKLTFNRRISRPGISYLDPTFSSTPQSTTSGNPHLQSTNYNTLNFNYGLIKAKFNLDYSLTYSFSNNALASTMKVVDNHIYYSYANVGHYRQLSTFLYAQWSPTDKARFSANMYFAIARYSMPDGTRLSRPLYNPTASYIQTLPCRFRLSVNVGWWSGGASSAYSYMKSSMAYFWDQIRIQRYFLSDNRLTIALVFAQPFGPYKRKSTQITDSPGYHSEHQICYPHNFSVGFSASFRFGSLKASVKKTAASIENNDLEGRKN